MSFERITVSFSDPDHFEDATEVYGDVETFPDEICRCVSLRGGQSVIADCGGFRCSYCRKVIGR